MGWAEELIGGGHVNFYKFYFCFILHWMSDIFCLLTVCYHFCFRTDVVYQPLTAMGLCF